MLKQFCRAKGQSCPMRNFASKGHQDSSELAPSAPVGPVLPQSSRKCSVFLESPRKKGASVLAILSTPYAKE